MKEKFVEKNIELIKKYYPEYDETILNERRYGLEGIYLTISKLIIIIPLSIFFNCFWNMILLIFLFNILRKTGFGIHSSSSFNCLIISIVAFVFIPIMCKKIFISIYIKLIISLLSVFSLILYAPADTKKRPLINRERALKLKYITVINACIICIISYYLRNNTLSNLFLVSVILEAITVNKFTYILSNNKFDNYKDYLGIRQNA